MLTNKIRERAWEKGLMVYTIKFEIIHFFGTLRYNKCSCVTAVRSTHAHYWRVTSIGCKNIVNISRIFKCILGCCIGSFPMTPKYLQNFISKQFLDASYRSLFPCLLTYKVGIPTSFHKVM